jgi:hypothetical protein
MLRQKKLGSFILLCLLVVWEPSSSAFAQTTITITPVPAKVTSQPVVTLAGTIAPPTPGKLSFSVRGVGVATNGVTVNKDVSLPSPGGTFSQQVDLSQFQNQGPVKLDIALSAVPPMQTAFQVVAVTSVDIEIDTEGPIAETSRLVGAPGATAALWISFRRDDFQPASLKAANFKLDRTAGTESYSTNVPLTADPIQDGNVLQLPLGLLYTDSYRLTILGAAPGGTATSQSPLQDKVGNPANQDKFGSPAKDRQLFFTSFPERQKGEHVEYPAFLKAGPGGPSTEGFDPGDKVDTRVIRLFYYRDAHRVVEIINRDAKRLNAAGVDKERFLAQEARTKAEGLTDDRRMAEIKAVQAVARARELRHKLDQTSKDLTDLSNQKSAFDAQQKAASDASLASAKKDLTAKSERLANAKADNTDASAKAATAKANADTAASAFAKAQQDLANTDPKDAAKVQAATTALNTANDANNAAKADLDNANNKASAASKALAIAQIESDNATQALKDAQTPATPFPQAADIDKMKGDKSSLENDLQNAQAAEIIASNTAIDTQAKENRSVEEQFRREVAAGTADYDTYAKGKISSFDPVTQVSMAVIGEGVIQCRGPVKGINKIARMIHQIDAPVGQVKVGIHTVQINGEHGDRMEYVYEKIDKHIAHCRFLTNQSLQLFRKAVQNVASQAAFNVDRGIIPPSCEPRPGRNFDFSQLTRDQKYIYAFFGKDFMDELARMDSELLRSDNKLISLHSMDTISLAGALYLTALAKNDIREMIQREFLQLAQNELPRIEVDYVRALTTIRAADPYINCILVSHFGDHLDARDARKIYERAARTYQFSNLIGFFNNAVTGNDTMNSVQFATLRMAQALKAQLVAEIEYRNLVLERSLLETSDGEIVIAAKKASDISVEKETIYKAWMEKNQKTQNTIQDAMSKLETSIHSKAPATLNVAQDPGWNTEKAELATAIVKQFTSELAFGTNDADLAKKILEFSANHIGENKSQTISNLANYLKENANDIIPAIRDQLTALKIAVKDQLTSARELQVAKTKLDDAKKSEQAQNKKVFAKRLLDQFMDEQEEKSVELLEAMRSHVSNVDNYLKRMVIALEDDVMAQFYNPAFQAVRRASRFWDVNFSQVETTTILTNNRAFAKVLPAATMEFDLPKRDILIKEGFQGAKALVQTYGELLNDKTFLSAAAMFAPTPAVGVPNSTRPLTEVNGQPKQAAPAFGTALDALIPDPSVYKFETGTGFEIRPVIQPDGQAIIYNFDYMYTTQIREPIRADEKHLGRVNRHFIHTDVQTGNYELRELSRYNVSLKASRTAKGVPLLQDIPGLGLLFRPLPSAESSLQQNVILASSVIYPTSFELMGLRWSPYADELDSPRLVRQKEAQVNRKETMRQELLSSVRFQVNERIGIENRGTLIEEGPPHEVPIPSQVPIPFNGPPIIEGTRSTFPGSSQSFVAPMPTPNNGNSPQIAPKFVPTRISPSNNSPSKPAEQGPLLDASQSSLNKSVIRAQTGSDPGDNQPFMRNAAIRSLQAVGGETRPDIASNPELAAAFIARGLDYLNRKDYDRALADCTQAVQLDPRSAQAHNLRGLANFFKNSPDRALVDFSNALALDATYAAVYTNRAMVNNSRKNYTGAIADCNQAIRFQPNLGQAYYNRCLAHQGLGNLDQARQDYETALRVDPGLGKR